TVSGRPAVAHMVPGTPARGTSLTRRLAPGSCLDGWSDRNPLLVQLVRRTHVVGDDDNTRKARRRGSSRDYRRTVSVVFPVSRPRWRIRPGRCAEVRAA